MNSAVEKLQARLGRLCVRDVKIFLSPDVRFMRKELEADLVKLLNSHLDGNSKPLGPIGDRLLVHVNG